MTKNHSRRTTAIRAALLVAGGALSTLACAGGPAGHALAGKYGCLACHAVDQKIVGPAYQEVAKRYRGDKKAEAKLRAKVRAGGAGDWGQIPMPPQTAPSDAELKTLVEWVLAGAPTH